MASQKKSAYDHPKRYAQKDVLDKIPRYTGNDAIVIPCYTNGLRWVCPNPRDPALCENIDKQYRQGFFISKREMSISPKDDDREGLWEP